MQILTSPDLLGTTTMPAHQSVGECTFVMTPNCSILPNSSCTFFRRGRGTLRGTNSENGLAFGLNFIEYPSVNVPKPVKRDGYWSG